MRRRSGLYCYEWVYGGSIKGASPRYSLMVLLGLSRAESHGIRTGVDLDGLYSTIIEHQGAFTAGDYGLALWAESRIGRRPSPGLVAAITRQVHSGRLAGLPGMEIAWLIIGLTSASVAGAPNGDHVAVLTNHLRKERLATSGLAYHFGRGHTRRHLPNFATQIYTLMALVELSRLAGDEKALAEAVTLGDHLLRLQRPDGGWPWLFHADSARTVEEYEVYSVHQDAMAPMGLLGLSAISGHAKYGQAAVDGLAWSRGANELRVDLLNRDECFAHRSIRRRWPWSRAIPGVASAAALAGRRPSRPVTSPLEVNRTCRPYHLGWILEAWAGRSVETAATPGSGPS